MSTIHNARQLLTACLLSAISASALAPIDLFCGTGDNLWVTHYEPLDSPATIDAMIDYTTRHYHLRRLYWRSIGNWVNMRVGRTQNEDSWDWIEWLRSLDNQFNADLTASRSAHRHGMQAYIYCGLFEFGLSPDAFAGYRFEFVERLNHPEWIGTDRWGERKEPGAISFAIPEARAFLVKYFTDMLDAKEFDGICFYTYVENKAIHYNHEFGFEPAVLSMFNAKYPDIDLKKDSIRLTEEQAEYWYLCRGHFVTLFLRELAASLHSRGKKLGMSLPVNGLEKVGYAQTWWNVPICGNGRIRLEYEKWIDEGIVDEIMAQYDGVRAQQQILNHIMPLVKGKPVELTVRSHNPYDPSWRRYREAGVAPHVMSTKPGHGATRYFPGEISIDSLKAADWCERAQACRDIASGKLADVSDETIKTLLAMADDNAVLVRRARCAALAKLASENRPELIPAIEAALDDLTEPSVRIAAALALEKAHRPESLPRLFAAIIRHPKEFQLKCTVVDTILAMGTQAYGELMQRLTSRNWTECEVAARCISKLVTKDLVGPQEADAAMKGFTTLLQDNTIDSFVQIVLVDKAVAMRRKVSATAQRELIACICQILEQSSCWERQLKAAELAGALNDILTDAERHLLRQRLLALFREYGDGCRRPDAAYGWRDVGNSMLLLGMRTDLETLMRQRQDAFSAYNAYKVLYDPQGSNAESRKTSGFNLIDEAKAIENHERFAPPFPGNRSW